MRTVANLLTDSCLEHVGIMVLEMFFWDHPVGRRIFNMTPEVSAVSRVLAANQGLYNGFLAAGSCGGLAGRPPNQGVLPRLRGDRRHLRRLTAKTSSRHPVPARGAGPGRLLLERTSSSGADHG